MKLLSLFSGIGAFEKALDRLSINYELVGYCEIDKYASKSYAAIHGVPESMNIGDITKVDEKSLPKDIDLITYGFPCQDISLAGKQKGLFNEDGSKTRSGLFFEALRIIEETQPRVAIAENVKNLTSKKFDAQFQIVLASLEAAGYNNYWQVLNSKDYGIPQNRERVFIVSIRKDIDTGMFKFPEGFPLELRLKDLCDAVVDEKYYLSDANITKILKSNFAQEATRIQNDDVCQTLLARDYKDPKCVEIEIERTGKNGEPIVSHIQMETDEPKMSATKLGNVYNDKFDGGGDFGGNVWDKNGIAPTLKTSAAASQQFIMVREATKKGYAEAYEGDSINLEQPNSKTRRGRVGHQVAQTLTTSCNQAVAVSEPNVLTPKRTEYGKEIRKAYESGEVQESRHNMTELVPRTDGISNTLTTVQKDNYLVEPSLRIRKLTPKEYYRLQDFDDEDFYKAEAVVSNTQLYKQAGNSITVSVPYYIFKALIDANILIEKENKQMELKMNEYQLPEQILFNYEELKQELTEKVSMYETLVYTDDQIKEAKADKANLNKLKKALNDERIRREKEYMVPFNDFKTKINEIISIIDKPVAVIDKQVKEYEEKQKQEKKKAIMEFFEKCNFHEIRFEQIFDERWLNASVSMKSVEEAIESKGEQIKADLETLSNLPEFGFESTQVYISTLDINKAIAEGHRMSEIAKAKAQREEAMRRIEEEQKAKAAEVAAAVVPETHPVSEAPAKQWIAFQALLSTDDALALKNFFNSRNIEFKAV